MCNSHQLAPLAPGADVFFGGLGGDGKGGGGLEEGLGVELGREVGPELLLAEGAVVEMGAFVEAGALEVCETAQFGGLLAGVVAADVVVGIDKGDGLVGDGVGDLKKEKRTSLASWAAAVWMSLGP